MTYRLHPPASALLLNFLSSRATTISPTTIKYQGYLMLIVVSKYWSDMSCIYEGLLWLYSVLHTEEQFSS